jgi:excisionase family DNA binding protein
VTAYAVGTSEAAALAGIDAAAIRAACREGRLKATKIGRDWLIERADAEAFAASERKPGRKPK